jgi:hypothetical protein
MRDFLWKINSHSELDDTQVLKAQRRKWGNLKKIEKSWKKLEKVGKNWKKLEKWKN